MDKRRGLPAGTLLSFPGMTCEIVAESGRGSNAIVYLGRYSDALNAGQWHNVLIKNCSHTTTTARYIAVKPVRQCAIPTKAANSWSCTAAASYGAMSASATARRQPGRSERQHKHISLQWHLLYDSRLQRRTHACGRVEQIRRAGHTAPHDPAHNRRA